LWLAQQKLMPMRFETKLWRYLQVDFGDTRVWIGDAPVNVFVATWGNYRRLKPEFW
jgi:hypothetical protein